ncbi:hypothetical protein IF1G_07359 [Cordyceps javanica]|uniref:EGF-like domain-containing protein n=1 Tax=Cordyceps javanica TaxID=43265 RepID=A0A545UVY1_9HYPO|nr:hypothetical protein IF1G_07359 [Cordyceps javanica]TQW02353.1 hypothetical protein IF2G_10156 [Cordyceps javanica]
MKGLFETARLALPRVLALTSVAAAAGTSTRCTTDEDCSLNGLCDTRSGACACDAGWIAADCGVLDLRPAKRHGGYNRTAEGTSSWGSRIVSDPSDAGLHHLFAAEFAHGCGLDYWAPYSRIVRAESRDGPAGPYTFAEEVAGTFAHNPTVVYSAADDEYLLYYIGCETEVSAARCTGKRFTCGPGNQNNGESGISLKTSKDLRTWTDVGQVFRGKDNRRDWDADVTNPSAFPLHSAADNTSAILLAYRGCPYDCGGSEQVNIAVAGDGYGGPYVKVQDGPLFPQGNEDLFVWRDRRGHWHMLTHSLEPEGGFGNGPKVGRHAYARNYTGPWTFAERSLAFDTTVRYDDGSEIRFFRRERPQLMFSTDGNMTPLLLTTGVQPRRSPMSYSVIVPIGDAGVKAQ